jgi:hypothetical protein
MPDPKHNIKFSEKAFFSSLFFNNRCLKDRSDCTVTKSFITKQWVTLEGIFIVLGKKIPHEEIVGYCIDK